MKSFSRCPLFSLAVMAVYVTVHIGVGALHHHHGDESEPGCRQSASEPDLQLQTSADDDDDDDDEEHCLLCSVLHLAQSLPGALAVEDVAALADLTFPALTSRPHPLETATHARAPPAA